MRKLVAVATVMGLMCFLASQAMAGPRLNYGQNLAAAKCSPSSANKMVLNVVFQVTNDVDSGVVGNYWAVDSYMKHVQVWDMGNDTYCVSVKYDGSFVTVQGPSPNGTTTVGAGVAGTMEGGYTGLITGGAFSPGTQRTKGNIGTKDYACSTTDGACSSQFDWVATYFPGATLTMDYWGWIYHAGDNGTWVNASTGNDGDIIGN